MVKGLWPYDLIEKLQVLKHDELLTRLSDACSVKEKGKGQKHKVFEPSFDAKPIYSDKFLNQKLDYIHHNPVSGKWSLCNEFTDYYHSSAAFYELNRLHNEVDIVSLVMRYRQALRSSGPSMRDPEGTVKVRDCFVPRNDNFN